MRVSLTVRRVAALLMITAFVGCSTDEERGPAQAESGGTTTPPVEQGWSPWISGQEIGRPLDDPLKFRHMTAMNTDGTHDSELALPIAWVVGDNKWSLKYQQREITTESRIFRLGATVIIDGVTHVVQRLKVLASGEGVNINWGAEADFATMELSRGTDVWAMTPDAAGQRNAGRMHNWVVPRATGSRFADQDPANVNRTGFVVFLKPSGATPAEKMRPRDPEREQYF